MLKLSESEMEKAAGSALESFALEAAKAALARLGGEGVDPALTRAKDPARADFQLNAAFALGKRLGVSPKEAAERLAETLSKDLEGKARAAVAGAGFVEIRLEDEWLMARALGERAGSLWPDLSGVRAVIDYSGPNCAKRMHVGHLRSTVIGDAIRGMLEASGAKVEAVNHIGDWGTPFGIILEQAKSEGLEIGSLGLAGIEDAYKRGAERFKADPSFAASARGATARMQAGLEPEASGWEVLRGSGLSEIHATYESLGVRLGPESVKGESAYQESVKPVLSDLLDRGVCAVEQGATCFFPGDGSVPLLLEKSAAAGGGALYGATDACALKSRLESGATHLIYVVDSRQSAHFSALFELGEKAGWMGKAQAIHAKFGMLLGPSGAPFKTRSGTTAFLSDLVEEAIGAAREAGERRGAEPGEESERLARMVGTGALKYADLSRPREGDIRFDAARACSLEGNTAVFLQYARARALSVAKKAEGIPLGEEPNLSPEERALALEIARVPGECAKAALGLAPHLAAEALYGLAKAFGSFYEACPALSGDGDGRRASKRRVALCVKAAETIGEVLATLGIPSPDALPKAKPSLAAKA